MTSRKLYPLLSVTLTLILIGLVLGVMQPAAVVQAGDRREGLPPRTPPTPTPAPDKHRDKDRGPAGAFIELRPVQAAPPGAWAVVQWQDSAGGWHDVEGWRGRLEPDGSQRWWVAPKDFGTGPFRWTMRQGPAGPLLGISQPFTLPAGAGVTLPVGIELGP